MKKKKEIMIWIIIILLGVASMYAIALRMEQIDRGAEYEKLN